MIDVGAQQLLPESELEYRFTRSGGPGGQHVNTSATRVEVVFNVLTSPTLSDTEKARAARRLGSRLDAEGRLRVVAQDERSQTRNRTIARERLADLLRTALAPPPPPRRPTRPTRAAREARLDTKRRSAARKRNRRPPAADD